MSVSLWEPEHAAFQINISAGVHFISALTPRLALLLQKYLWKSISTTPSFYRTGTTWIKICIEMINYHMEVALRPIKQCSL